jgi:hypothetical protein
MLSSVQHGPSLFRSVKSVFDNLSINSCKTLLFHLSFLLTNPHYLTGFRRIAPGLLPSLVTRLNQGQQALPLLFATLLSNNILDVSLTLTGLAVVAVVEQVEHRGVFLNPSHF